MQQIISVLQRVFLISLITILGFLGVLIVVPQPSYAQTPLKESSPILEIKTQREDIGQKVRTVIEEEEKLRTAIEELVQTFSKLIPEEKINNWETERETVIPKS